jgi:GTPase
MIVSHKRQILEKVLLASLFKPGEDRVVFEQDLNEMAMLCTTAGATVALQVVQKAPPTASTYLGSGKLAEISASMKEHGCKTLVIDADLSPGQVRNIENVIEAKVIDRGQLILDIFAQHATTTEARVQVELAQLRTIYPRLTHAWTKFSQQVGGIGTRGPGEKQLEVDRRVVQRKITDLKHRIKDLEKTRATQRKSRSDAFKVTLAGYTNVGKSSLLNALTNAGVLVENKLFATLDTATRRIAIPGFENVVISDTVGFLRKLPHNLVASFHSTLAVVEEADLIIIVLDASTAWNENQLQTVNEVITGLGAGEKRRLVVFNKADLKNDPFDRKGLEILCPGSLFVSARTGEGLDVLRARIGETVMAMLKATRLPDEAPLPAPDRE